MPVQVQHPEPMIYVNIITGNLTLEEMHRTILEMGHMADANNEPHFVLISDATALRNIPFDVQNLRKIAEYDPRIIALLVVNASFVVKVAADLVGKVSPLTVEHAKSVDEALPRARALLEKRQTA
jgi:hypothetical protein